MRVEYGDVRPDSTDSYKNTIDAWQVFNHACTDATGVAPVQPTVGGPATLSEGTTTDAVIFDFFIIARVTLSEACPKCRTRQQTTRHKCRCGKLRCDVPPARRVVVGCYPD